MHYQVTLAAWQPSSAQIACRDAIADAFGIDRSAMVSRSRKGILIPGRHAAAWVLKQRWPRLSWPQIGKMLGGRDHSTVIYGARQCAAWRENDEDYRAKTDALVGQNPPGFPVRAEGYRKGSLPSEYYPVEPREEELPTENSNEPSYRSFMAEIMSYPEPKPHQLNIQLKGGAGCPRLPLDEIERRRAATAEQRRAYELRHLRAEQQRYGLRSRGRALSEMVL